MNRRGARPLSPATVPRSFPPGSPLHGQATIARVEALTNDRIEPSRLPAGRAAWCGQLQLGDFQLPVKAFPATVTSRDSSLCQIHAACGGRIQQCRFCPQHGELSAGEIGKAYAYGPDDLVGLSAAELAQLDAADEKTITLRRFVSETDFDLCLLSGRAFYLVPAHTAAGADYGGPSE